MLSEGGIPGGTIPEEEAHSRASVISRRSNADQKGEHLVKFDPKQVINDDLNKEMARPINILA